MLLLLLYVLLTCAIIAKYPQLDILLVGDHKQYEMEHGISAFLCAGKLEVVVLISIFCWILVVWLMPPTDHEFMCWLLTASFFYCFRRILSGYL